jgi:aldehyde dehydrogenase (NAD+)
VLKASEDAPETALSVAKLASEAGLPAGVFNVVHGLGHEAGEPLVRDERVGVISFTGSTAVGRRIATIAGERLARVSLELGGKNALVICDDADLDNAVKWSALSAFSNAGQRCAAASRLIVMDRIYDEFRKRFFEKIASLRVGPTDADDFGPVINRRQLDNMLAAVLAARDRGATVSCGGERLDRPGCYLGATVIENVSPDDPISNTELFGPITCIYRVSSFTKAIELANATPYGLTACVHTASVHRAMQFVRAMRAGTVVVNAGTYGSEPHLPFGGFKHSGNGSREPGTEALDVYSELKTVSLNFDPSAV